MEPISKSKLKELATFRQQKFCDLHNLFVAEGEKLASEIMAMGIHVQTLCATRVWLEAHSAMWLDKGLCSSMYLVTDEQLQRLSSLRQPNEVWMLLERQVCEIHNSQFKIQNSKITLALDRLQDPGNLGTIIRTADWFGVRHIVCSPDTVSRFNPKVVQSTMGSLFRVSVECRDLAEWLPSCGMPVYGAVLDGDDLRSVVTATPAVILVGNESRGISSSLQPFLTHRVTIPNIGDTCESLNAAVATSILLSHWIL
ncbi:MAG: RNA methyltransferase [Bacteroidales bacterium]|nr:RNA methyltransferase [Bacteroidales bacterium]